jgi:hypothetical protein
MPTLSLPPFSVLSEAAAALVAEADGNKPRQNALNKALWNLAHEIEIIPVAGGFLLPSATRTTVIHRVGSDGQCACEAGAAGRICWHVATLELIERAQQRAIPMAVRISAARAARYREAVAQMDELFA